MLGNTGLDFDTKMDGTTTTSNANNHIVNIITRKGMQNLILITLPFDGYEYLFATQVQLKQSANDVLSLMLNILSRGDENGAKQKIGQCPSCYKISEFYEGASIELNK